MRNLSKLQQRNYLIILETKADLMQKIIDADPETDTQEAKDYIAMLDSVVNAEQGTEDWLIFNSLFRGESVIFDVIGYPPEL